MARAVTFEPMARGIDLQVRAHLLATLIRRRTCVLYCRPMHPCTRAHVVQVRSVRQPKRQHWPISTFRTLSSNFHPLSQPIKFRTLADENFLTRNRNNFLLGEKEKHRKMIEELFRNVENLIVHDVFECEYRGLVI